MIRITVYLVLFPFLMCLVGDGVTLSQPTPKPVEPEKVVLGSWRVVKLNNEPTKPGFSEIVIFTADGKFVFQTDGPNHHLKQTFRYLIEKDSITLQEVSSDTKYPKANIISISKDKLILRGSENGKISEFVRLQK